MGLLDGYFSKIEPCSADRSVVAFLAIVDSLMENDPLVADAILQELKDQRRHINLIASENYSSLRVQFATGNLLADKYSEGIPSMRYYPRCNSVDVVESLAIERAKQLFDVDHAYVQPHSGSDANLIAMWAVLVHRVQRCEVEKLGAKKLEDLSASEIERIRLMMVNQKVMGLAMDSGGHISHGFVNNISSKMVKAISFSVDKDTGLLDYDVVKKLAMEEKPLIMLIGSSSYPRLINFAKMREIADMCGATLIADMAHCSILVAGRVLPGINDPTKHADIITFTTHKFGGPRGGAILCSNVYKGVVNVGCPLVMGGPNPAAIAGKAVAFGEAMEEDFHGYGCRILANAKAMSDQFISDGIPVVTGGTDTHMVLIDVVDGFGLTGKQAEEILLKAMICVNRNVIPKGPLCKDPNGRRETSGIRIGTNAITKRGVCENGSRWIAHLISSLLKSKGSVEWAREEVASIVHKYELYPEIVVV